MRALACLSLAAAAIFALPLPISAQETEGMTSAPVIGVSLTDRIWVRTDQPDLPGAMQLFLSDGTLLSDSCWETYRLSSWRMIDEQHIVWEEDGIEIQATIVSLDEAQLILELDLGEPVTHAFELAPVPFVCPDMPR